MFIKKTTKTDRNKNKTYHQYQLIESVRTSRGPRQHILLNLGTDLDLSDEDRKELANCIEERIKGIQPLFPRSSRIEKLACCFAKQLVERNAIKPSETNYKNESANFYRVDVDSIEFEHVRTIGLEHICLETIKELQLDKILLNVGFSKRQVEVAIGVIIARLGGCCSERSIHRWLREISGVGELMEDGFDRLSSKSVYQIADQLVQNKDEIEKRLYEREKNLFSLNDTILFYDLTNTYFEGKAKSIWKASKGRSKDSRADCPLVTLGLRLDQNGFPMRSEVLPGSVSEPGTLKEAISQLDNGNDTKPTIVLDAGLATEENIEWLRVNGYSYVVCSRRRDQTPPSDLPLEIVCKKKGNIVRAGSVKDLATNETLLYCHSKFKETKETEWLQSTRSSFEEALRKLNNGLKKKGHTKGLAAVHTKIGSIRKRYSRIAQFYTIETTTDPSEKIVTAISWSFDEERASNRLSGNYCLRTYGLDKDIPTLWEIYIMLTNVEEAFRCLKSELGMRPIHHQLDRRCDGHLFITVLAYHVLQSIQVQLREQGINLRWETIRNRLQTHARVTSKMATETGAMLHIRSATNPEPFHQSVYRALNVAQKPGPKIKKNF